MPAACRSLMNGLCAALCCAALDLAAPLEAAEVAERPFLIVAASRYDRVLYSLELLLDVADRPELTDVIAERYRHARDFAGLDRTRPFGLMRTWRVDHPLTPETEQPADILFLPVSDRVAFLQTITGGTIPYRERAPNLIAIDRPDVPYHVLFHDGYAWLGDDVAQLTIFAQRRERLLSRIPNTAELALVVDFDQIPQREREAAWAQWALSAEPLLQRRDQETIAAYEFRRQNTQWLVRSLPELAAATRQLLITQTLRPDERRSEWSVEVTLSATTPAAKSLLGWRPQPTPLARLDDPQAVAWGAVRGVTLDVTGQPWDIGWQVFGRPFEQRIAVVMMQGPDAVEVARQAKSSGPAEFELGNGTMRRVTIPLIPVWLKRFVGWDPEIWLGDDGRRVWLGFGPPEDVRRRLERAFEILAASPDVPDRAVAARWRLSARDLTPFVPGFDPGWADQLLFLGGDRIEGSAEAIGDRLVLRSSFDFGVLRVLGATLAHELSLELDQAVFAPPAPAN